NDLSRKLLAVPGVGAVNRVGGVTREIRVAVDPLKLQSLGITAADISRQLRQVQTESAGGRTDVGGGEQPVRTLATVQTAREIGNLEIAIANGRTVRLSDVAEVLDTVAERRSAALLDGKPVVGFEVSRSRGESEVQVGAAVPMSVIPAFIGMHLLGFSINVVTLLALSLVIGILVDDAIVEVENIVRHLQMGKTPYQAAMEAADEIGLAVIATTFTLIAVFLPTAFMSGIAGKFFKQFGWTASLAVFASLVVARVLTPPPPPPPPP